MKNVLAFGDSNTWGLIPGTKDRFPWGIRWTSIIQENLEGVRVIEEGLCGRTTVFEDELRPLRKAIDVLPMVLETITPIDYAIVMLGTNDCKSAFNASSKEITAGLELCLKKFLDVVAPENILLISPLYLETAAFDFGFNERSIAVSRELKQDYKDLADKYNTAFLAASDYVKASSLDGQHLTEEGHRALCEVVLKSIVSMKLLNETIK